MSQRERNQNGSPPTGTRGVESEGYDTPHYQSNKRKLVQRKDGLCVDGKLEGKTTCMIVDTGSNFSIVTNCYGTLQKTCYV